MEDLSEHTRLAYTPSLRPLTGTLGSTSSKGGLRELKRNSAPRTSPLVRRVLRFNSLRGGGSVAFPPERDTGVPHVVGALEARDPA